MSLPSHWLNGYDAARVALKRLHQSFKCEKIFIRKFRTKTLMCIVLRAQVWPNSVGCILCTAMDILLGLAVDVCDGRCSIVDTINPVHFFWTALDGLLLFLCRVSSIVVWKRGLHFGYQG